MHHVGSLDEAYQSALKVEEKFKRSSSRRVEKILHA